MLVLGMSASLFGFFLFIILALVVLLCVKRVVNKYLRGDYAEVSGESDEEEEELLDVLIEKKIGEDEENKGEMFEEEAKEVEPSMVIHIDEPINERPPPPPYELVSPKLALLKIKNEGFEESFASSSKIKISFEYEATSKLISGSVKSIQGLRNQGGDPTLISFHIKVIPSRKYKVKTKWIPSDGDKADLKFKLGPLASKLDNDSSICVHLYGRKRSTISKPKCYGECLVPLNSVLETDGVVEVVQRVLPKSDSRFKKRRSSTIDDFLTNKSNVDLLSSDLESSGEFLETNDPAEPSSDVEEVEKIVETDTFADQVASLDIELSGEIVEKDTSVDVPVPVGNDKADTSGVEHTSKERTVSWADENDPWRTQ